MAEDETPTEDLETTEPLKPMESGAPVRIGPYRILQKIGEGGMGEVYEAEQETPVRRRVALKIIKRGMDTDHVVARFEAERQALALMNHPYVAKVFDAGSTQHGRPYFAMEYVEGVPITTFCDRQRLTTKERLELFMQVCEGVQHAHQNALIHRDIKPSNVLVTTQDGRRIPKIIDFGVAKATAQPLTERTVFTEFGQFIGTREYMSPEQAEMTRENVDTRTDVYALGVLLYEVLVGALPFDPGELRQASFDEIRRKIREDEPPKPSTRISALGTASTETAKRRRTDPASLARALRGELDWITMKALEKDRTRRYRSPAEFSADLGRYLADEPVLAGPPSTTYRAMKFFRRHRVAVSVAAAGVLVLVAFAAAMALQANRIATERDLAEQATADLESVVAFQAGMLGDVDPEQMGVWLARDLRESIAQTARARGLSERQVADFLESYDTAMRGVNMTNTALEVVDRDILGRAVATLEERFGDRPLVDARLRGTIGETYRKLGRYEAAEPQLEKAFEIRRRVLGDDHRDTFGSMINLADLYRNQGRYDEAEPLYLEALERQKRVLGDDHPDTLVSLGNLAILYDDQGRYDEAEALYLETLEIRKRVLGDDHPDTLSTLDTLAGVYWSQGRYDEAEPLYLEALGKQKRLLGENHPHTLASINNLAGLYWNQGRYDEAEPLFLEAHEGCRRVLGDDHPRTLTAMANLANLYRKQGRYDEAEPLLVEALAAQKRVLGDDHPSTLISMGNLGDLYVVQQRPELGVQLLAAAVAVARRALPREHVLTGVTIRKYGVSLTALGRYDDAEANLLEAHAILTAAVGAEHPQTQKAVSNFVELYEAWNKPARAAEWRAKLPAEE